MRQKRCDTLIRDREITRPSRYDQDLARKHLPWDFADEECATIRPAAVHRKSLDKGCR